MGNLVNWMRVRFWVTRSAEKKRLPKVTKTRNGLWCRAAAATQPLDPLISEAAGAPFYSLREMAAQISDECYTHSELVVL